jgi:nucleoside-diphosphate-sugar epimerase
MKIALTGGTGYIGAALLGQLLAAGHEVTALVRSDAAGAKVAARGARPATGDFLDPDWLTPHFAAADAVVHTASPGDATSETFERSVAEAAVRALSGTGKAYVHTSGIWVYGDGATITEESPFAPPALTAWRAGVEQIVLDADLVTTVVAPGIVYGYGAGIPAGVFGERAADGRVPLVGDGEQHWTTVHVDDVAALYKAVAERGEKLGYLIAASGDNPTVREIGEAAGRGAGVAPESVEASRERLGTYFADALLLDQQASGDHARELLGWAPKGPTLVDDMRSGSYAG